MPRANISSTFAIRTVCSRPKSSISGPTPSFFYAPHWSPDSKRIAFTDKHLRIWYVDVAGGKPVKIDTGLRGGFDARHRAGLVARLAVDRLQPRPRESDARDLRLFAGHAHVDANHRRHEQRGASGLRSAAASTCTSPRRPTMGRRMPASISPRSIAPPTAASMSSYCRAMAPRRFRPRATMKTRRRTTTPRRTMPRRTMQRTAPRRAIKTGQGRQDRRQGKGQEEGRRQTEAHRDRSGRDRQSNSVAAHSRAQLRRPGRRQDRRAVSRRRPGRGPSFGGGRSPVRALWRFTTEKRLTEEMLSGLTDFKVSFDGEKLFYSRKDKLVHRAYRGSQTRFAGRGRGQAGEQWRHVRHARSARRVEADVSRDLAFAARFSLRPALSRPRSRQDRSQVPALPRWSGLARRVHLSVRSRCWAKFKSATCSCAVRMLRRMRRSPGCSAPTTRSSTIATSSPRSTTVRTGLRR